MSAAPFVLAELFWTFLYVVARARRCVITRACAFAMRVFSRSDARRRARGGRARRHGLHMCARAGVARRCVGAQVRVRARARWAVERDGVVSARGTRDGMDARRRGARVRAVRARSMTMG